MKKLITKLGIVLMTSATINPLLACSFNFYVNRATSTIAKSFADQTSAVIKSLVMSKELNADTISTNNDIMGQIKNSSIANPTKDNNINNWNELANKWGYNGTIKAGGSFFPDDYFIAAGKGQLTKDITSRKSTNNILNTINSYLPSLAILDNNQLHDALPQVIPDIISFLQQLQAPSDQSPMIKLLRTIINNYDTSFATPFKRLVGNLISNNWNEDVKAPTNINELKTFMANWKDESGQPYSAWSDGKSWDISVWSIATGHKKEDWSKEDYSIYRSGVLINYLFWKMSKDNNIHTPGATSGNPRYLSDIINEYVKLAIPPKIDDKKLIIDLKQYLPYLLTNPQYVLLIVEAIIPIVKKFMFNMNDITAPFSHLTLGNGYPTNPDSNSYNLLDGLNTIKQLINNPTELKAILLRVFGATTKETRGFDTLLYDFKLHKGIRPFEIKASLGDVIGSGSYNPSSLIDQLIPFITSDSIKNTVNDICDIVGAVANEYPNNQGIDIDLGQLQPLLITKDTGLIDILKLTIDKLAEIIKPDHEIKADDIYALYESLGGNSKGEPAFTPNSVLDIIKKSLNSDGPVTSILALLIGKNDTPMKKGITNIITNRNNEWIKNHYENYFDASDSTGMNMTIGKTYNIKMTKSRQGNIETINLDYSFDYQINGKTYFFVIKMIDIEDLTSFQGVRDFKFQNIDLINVK